MARRWPGMLLAIVWMCLLAAAPWWLGLPILLSMSAALFIHTGWLHEHALLIRRGLRWGLPGWLFALFLALGGGVLGFTLTLLGALIGFSLLVLLESWFDHKPTTGVGGSPKPAIEWNEMALAPVGPEAVIIELLSPHWLPIDGPLIAPQLGIGEYADHRCILRNNHQIEGVDPLASVGDPGDWLALMLVAGRGVLLYHHAKGHQHRLRGWQLYGWHDGQPWLSRGEDSAPMSLSHVLGQDRRDDSEDQLSHDAV